MKENQSSVTIKDIAKAAEVSIATVSRVFNEVDYPIKEKTREKVLAVAKELGYTPNLIGKYLKTQKSDDIGILVPNLSNPLFVEAIRQIEQVFAEKGYHVLFASSERCQEKETKILNNFVAKKVCAIILIDIEGHEVLLKKVAEQGILIAAICGSENYDFHLHQFSCNLRECGKIAATHLLKSGCKRIVYLSGPLNKASRQQIFSGYKACLEEKKIGVDEHLLCIAENEVSDASQNYEYHNGYQLAKKLIERKVKFDAVLAGNDMTAIGAMEALREAGVRIPEDVSVMGIDNTMISSVTGLSTVETFYGEMGKNCAEIMIRSLRDEETCEKQVLQPELVLRKSTKNI